MYHVRRSLFATWARLLLTIAMVLFPFSIGNSRKSSVPQSGQEESRADDGSEESNDACDQVPNLRREGKGKHTKCPRGGSSSGIAKGDFNGDGVADLAIGVPNKDTPVTVAASGAVIVI